MKKILLHAQRAVALAVAAIPASVLAQSGGVSSSAPPGRAITLDYILSLVSRFATFLFALAGTIAVIVIVYGGLVWMTKGSEEGKTILIRGIIGIAIVLGTGVILATISRIVSVGI